MKVLNPFKDMTKEQLDTWDDISVNSNKPILKKIPVFKKGDKIRATIRVMEKGKVYTKDYEGICVDVIGEGFNQIVNIRKIIKGVAVERILPLDSDSVTGVRVIKRMKRKQPNGKVQKISKKRYYNI